MSTLSSPGWMPITAPLPVAVPLLDVSAGNQPLEEEILAAIARVCRSGKFVLGPDCAELEAALAAYCQVEHSVGCASGSDALLLALMALEIGSGDEVILPSFTFFATAGAVWRLGARPVFVDIDPTTFNIDPNQVARHITPRTKAILAVHLFGACADMVAIQELAQPHGIAVIEDAAQAIGAELGGRRAGSLGEVGCFSFYPTKNLGAFGDGGMLTTHSATLAERLRVLRDHGQHPRYHHQAVGINSRLDTIQAAVLRVKLPHLDRWVAQRTRNALRYHDLFTRAALESIVRLPVTSDGGRCVWNQYTIRVPAAKRDSLQTHLATSGIATAIYYPVPLHLQPCFATLGYQPGSLPHTERAAAEVLSLPIFPELTEAQQSAVVAQIQACLLR